MKMHRLNRGAKRPWTKILRIMKLTVILLFGSLMAMSASSYSQNTRLNLSAKNSSLIDIFRQIEDQSEFYFYFNKEEVKSKELVSVDLKEALVTDILNQVLSKTGLEYKIIDRYVVVKQTGAADPAISMQPGHKINGQVTDVRGTAIPGVSVVLKGTTTGVTTNSDGKYTLTASPDAKAIVFSFVGMVSQEIAIGNKTTIDVVLSEEITGVDEVIVTALGIKKEAKRLGYSTGTVTKELITNNRTVNVGNSLQGKVAGLNVSPPAGGPGGSSKIRIRGQSSFGGNNSPLIIVNGVPISNSAISAGGSAGNGTGNPTGGSSDQGDGLQSINQDDIESMTVLNGAAAAALYGFRAKDGAIIITTKSGQGKQGIGVELNSNFLADQALDFTDFQYVYGQGEFGKRPTTTAEAQSSGVHSFGEKFDGVATPQFDGTTQPYSPNKNRIKDFYRTGISSTNSVALTGNIDKGNFRASFANTDANAIVPNSDYHKKILNFGLNY